MYIIYIFLNYYQLCDFKFLKVKLKMCFKNQHKTKKKCFYLEKNFIHRIT